MLDPAPAPEALEPEPFIPDPAPLAEDDLSLPEPDENPLEQTPVEDDPEPLISVEPEQNQDPGLEDIVAPEDADGEDNAGDDGDEDNETLPETIEPPEEVLVAEEEEPVTGDDIFDEEPVLTRRFTLPRVALPTGDTTIEPSTSGVVAIFCPEEFSNEDKAAECAGRREILSGWRPGQGTEDFTRAEQLLRRARTAGQTGPDLDKVVGTISSRRIRDADQINSLNDFRRGVGETGNVANSFSDNLAGDSPNVGPPPLEPTWTFREDGELTQKEIEELEEALREAEENK